MNFSPGESVNDLKCVECEQTEESMLVFVGTLQHEDGTIEDLPEGMHPYCDPCREKLNITDELNAGRDLRAEARQAVLNAVEQAEAASRSGGIDAIMSTLDQWLGGTDQLSECWAGRRWCGLRPSTRERATPSVS